MLTTAAALGKEFTLAALEGAVEEPEAFAVLDEAFDRRVVRARAHRDGSASPTRSSARSCSRASAPGSGPRPTAAARRRSSACTRRTPSRGWPSWPTTGSRRCPPWRPTAASSWRRGPATGRWACWPTRRPRGCTAARSRRWSCGPRAATPPAGATCCSSSARRCARPATPSPRARASWRRRSCRRGSGTPSARPRRRWATPGATGPAAWWTRQVVAVLEDALAALGPERHAAAGSRAGAAVDRALLRALRRPGGRPQRGGGGHRRANRRPRRAGLGARRPPGRHLGARQPRRAARRLAARSGAGRAGGRPRDGAARWRLPRHLPAGEGRGGGGRRPARVAALARPLPAPAPLLVARGHAALAARADGRPPRRGRAAGRGGARGRPAGRRAQRAAHPRDPDQHPALPPGPPGGDRGAAEGLRRALPHPGRVALHARPAAGRAGPLLRGRPGARGGGRGRLRRGPARQPLAARRLPRRGLRGEDRPRRGRRRAARPADRPTPAGRWCWAGWPPSRSGRPRATSGWPRGCSGARTRRWSAWTPRWPTTGAGERGPGPLTRRATSRGCCSTATGPGDRERAAELAGQALATATELGLGFIAARAEPLRERALGAQ